MSTRKPASNRPGRGPGRQRSQGKPGRPGASNRPPRAQRGRGGSRPPATEGRDGRFWLYGLHAGLAALANPRRRCHRVLVAEGLDPEVLARVESALAASGEARPGLEPCPRHELDRMLPEGTVHQGLLVQVAPLPMVRLPAVWAGLAEDASASVVVLDQASDPRNIGAVLRSAAAFGARGVVVQVKHAPEETGALAKAASGALETVPYIRVTNISRAMEELKAAGFWCVGLDASGEQTLAQAAPKGRVALVLGSEGGGLRRLVRETCDLLVRIPIASSVESLNLSNAAAVSLYELGRDHG